MTPGASESLRRASAHVLVDDVDLPALDDATGHHLFRVLRLRDNDDVTVTDGAGSWRRCRAIGGALEPDSPTEFVSRRDEPVIVGFAIPKQDRPEWIVQKLTELGVDRIQLLHADRSVVRWAPDRADRHLSKLRRVAAEALQQSRGVWLPQIEGPVPASSVLPAAAAAEPGGRPLSAADRTIVIGPEGGWSPDELAMAADCVALGDRVLRVETAAIVGAAHLVAHAK